MLNLNLLKSDGQLLNGRYKPKERIGGGGFSDVWLAHDVLSRVDVVLKVYASAQDLDEEGIQMFRREFSLVCNLNHTNILKPFTFDIFQGSAYIVLPLCERGSASQLIGNISEEELWNFTTQVAAGLAYIHRHNIIHQDIKPANVLMNTDGQYLITDFGISTGLRNTIRRNQQADEAQGSGTTAYMSHECFGARPVNVMARDIWAFGATLYELATGDVPFGDYGGLTQKSDGGKVPDIKADVSDEMKALINSCLALNAWDRPSAEEILNMVANHGNGMTATASLPLKKVAILSFVALLTLGFIGWQMWPRQTVRDIVQVKTNSEDSILLERVKEADSIVRIEKGKNNIAAVDENKLCEAARIYASAMTLKANDSIKQEGQSMWKPSQTLINDTYTYLNNKKKEYLSVEATDAARTFNRRSQLLQPFVTADDNASPTEVKKKKYQ